MRMGDAYSQMLAAFENAKPGERILIIDKDGGGCYIGRVVEKDNNGTCDSGWCIRINTEQIGKIRLDHCGFMEIPRITIKSIEFLPEEGSEQLSLPFDDQIPLGILV